MMFSLALIALAAANPTADCAADKCFMQSLLCISDPTCGAKAECALNCDTASCVTACAGPNPDSLTANLEKCVVDNGCVAPGFQINVVSTAVESYKQTLAKRNPTADCAAAKCFTQSLLCISDPTCGAKAECALNCDTASCVTACAGPNPDSLTANLEKCVVDNGCVAPGFQRDVVSVAKSAMQMWNELMATA